MKRFFIFLTLLLMAPVGAMATDVTWADKSTGGSFSAAEANEVKAAVNSKQDELAEGAFVDGDKTKLDALDTAKQVTNGDSHDHAGGDGAQIDHGGLAGLGDDDHTQYPNTAGEVVTMFDSGTCSGYLKSDGTCDTPTGSGDVVGPASSTNNCLAIYDGTTGKLLKDGNVCQDGSNNYTFPAAVQTTQADGSRKLSVDANTVAVSPTASSFEIYPDSDNRWKMNNNGTETEIVGTSDTQTLTNKDLSSGTNTFPTSLATDAEVQTKYVSGTEADWHGALMTPQGVYDIDSTNHAFTIINDVPAPFTITEINISCDADPTTELTITFQHKAAGVGYGTPTTIEAVTTTAGVATVTSGIDDPTIPAGVKVFGVLSDPDDALLECAFQIEGAWD